METENIVETHIFGKAINKFIELLNSQIDSFPVIMNTLVAKLNVCSNRLDKYMKTNKIRQIQNDGKINISIPINEVKQFIEYQTEIGKAVSAIQLIPQNIVVAFVSIYDAFLADLIEGMYTLCPSLLNSCEREYTFSELLEFSSIDDIKKNIIEKEVECVLRESHAKQFEWLSKKLKIKLTEDLPNYDDFIEITERRNLFVHTRGKVSRQYISAVSAKFQDGKDGNLLKAGDSLGASPDYVNHCYNILFEIGVKLGQVVWRKLDEANSLEEADTLLISIIYDLIRKGDYNLASVLSDFATKSYVKDFDKSHTYLKCVNKALVYYLSGNKDKCKDIISKEDWSATNNSFKLAVAVLEENYEQACIIMKEIGKKDNILDAYREWPLFNVFRESPLFKETYKEIFGTDCAFVEKMRIEWEEVIKEAKSLLNNSQNKKSKKEKNKSENGL